MMCNSFNKKFLDEAAKAQQGDKTELTKQEKLQKKAPSRVKKKGDKIDY